MSKKTKKVVCLGGGTGIPIVLAGLKKYPVDLTAIVTMFDSGGSSGKLRDELGIFPVGDLRQCLLSLSDKSDLTSFFHYRFERGILKGHNLGNLLIAASIKATGNLEKAIEKIGKILEVKGRVIPVTLGKSDIEVILKNNKRVKGEENIINCQNLSKIGIKKLFLNPKVKANPKAVSAIKNANLIVISPGKFYTSIISNLLIKRITGAIRKSKAKKVFVCNLMTQVGNTDNFGVEDFLRVIEKYLGKNNIDYVIFNTGRLSGSLERQVKKAFPGGKFISYNKDLLKKKNFIGADILDRKIRKINPADIFIKGANKRTMVLHDSNKLARIILKLCKL